MSKNEIIQLLLFPFAVGVLSKIFEQWLNAFSPSALKAVRIIAALIVVLILFWYFFSPDVPIASEQASISPTQQPSERPSTPQPTSTPRPTATPTLTPAPRFELIVTDGRRALSPVNGVYALRVGETIKLRITNIDKQDQQYEIHWQGGGEKGSGRLMLTEGITNMYTAQRRGNDYVRVRVYNQRTGEMGEPLFVLIHVL